MTPFGFVAVTHTYSPIAFYTLHHSYERIDVFVDPRHQWVSIKDYNHGRKTQITIKLISAIQLAVAKEYGAKVRFRSKSDCLG